MRQHQTCMLHEWSDKRFKEWVWIFQIQHPSINVWKTYLGPQAPSSRNVVKKTELKNFFTFGVRAKSSINVALQGVKWCFKVCMIAHTIFKTFIIRDENVSNKQNRGEVEHTRMLAQSASLYSCASLSVPLTPWQLTGRQRTEADCNCSWT